MGSQRVGQDWAANTHTHTSKLNSQCYLVHFLKSRHPDKRGKTRQVVALLSGVQVAPRAPRCLLRHPISESCSFPILGWPELSGLRNASMTFHFSSCTMICNWFWFSCLTNENLPQNSIRREKSKSILQRARTVEILCLWQIGLRDFLKP